MFSKHLAVLLACLCVSTVAFAGTITVVGNGDDQGIWDGGSFWVGQPDFRVGNGNGNDTVAVFVFELPVLPAGETVDTADFAFSITGGSNWRALYENGIDLYGVRMASDSAVLASDMYVGDYGCDPAEGVTAIQDYIVYEEEALNQALPGDTGRIDTSAAGEAALGAWLQSLYSSDDYNAEGSNFAFLRLNARTPESANRYWVVASGDNANEVDKPMLSLSTIPEPATVGLLALGSMALIRRKK